MGLKAADPPSHRPHVLLLACPGATAVRLAAESAVAALGGHLAMSPADADVLLVAGSPAAELQTSVDELWARLPGPRVRVAATAPEPVAEMLRTALSELTRGAARRDGQDRQGAWDASRGDGEAGRLSRHGGHTGREESEMEMPGGLPMADRAEDRDGLKLDVLHVPLGPWLPHWPGGLVIDTRMQGDVVQQAEARPLSAARSIGTPFWHAVGDPAALQLHTAAAHLDSLARLLAVAGWPSAAERARGLRDRALGGETGEGLVRDCTRWRRRVARSRLLRWSTDGLGVLTAAHAARLGVGGPAARTAEPWDATARWQQWLTEVGRLLEGERAPEAGPRGQPDVSPPPSRALLDAVTELLPGLDLAAARLLVASFDPDPDELVQAQPQSAGEVGR